MDDPEYIVLIALDTPSRETGLYISGGVMAAPTVGAVMGDILPYLGVHQSDPPEQILLDDLTGLSVKEAESILKARNITAILSGEGDTVVSQIPRAGQTIPAGSRILLYLGE